MRYACFSESCDYEGEDYTFQTTGTFQCPKCGNKTDIRTVTHEPIKIMINPDGRTKLYNPLTVKDILTYSKPLNYIIENVFYPNTINCLVSEYSSFKSILAMYTAICISKGISWFGYKTTKGNVLVIDNENNIQQIKSRYKALINGLELQTDITNIYYLLKEGKLTDPTFLEYVQEFIKLNDIKFIIIDTLIRSQIGLDENSSKDMNYLYDIYSKLLINDAAVLFLHHTNKDGKYRGSTDILGMSDTEFQIIRPVKHGPKFILINEKNRMGEIDNIEGTVEYDKTNNITIISGVSVPREEVEKEETNKFNAARQFIMKYIEVVKIFKISDLYIEVDAYNSDNPNNEISKYAVKRALSWMKKKGIIEEHKKRGIYKYVEPLQSKIVEEVVE